MGALTNPRQTVIITCRSKVDVLGKSAEKDNAITVDWHMPVSLDPQMYAISIGKGRFSAGMIHDSGVFVVNFVPFEMKESAAYIGRHSGEHEDKISAAGLKAEEAQAVDCPRISGALGYAECEVVNEIEAGDHIIFIGKIVSSNLQKEGKRLFHIWKDEFTTTR